MIVATAGRPAAAFVEDAPTNLVGVLSARLVDASSVEVIAWTTAGITVAATGDEWDYKWTFDAPAAPGFYTVEWDDGVVTFDELVEVTGTAPSVGGSYTHSFSDTTPPARFDAIPWTRLLVEESPDGVIWTLIDDQAIAIDPTPATPNPVAVTVSTSTLESGFFRFRFDVTPSNPSTYSPAVLSPAPAYRPTVEQVAAILRARTRGIASRDAAVAGEQGTFTATTRPTASQVQELIDVAVGELAGMMGGRAPCTTSLETSAGTAAAYRAAQLVEISYYPEQTGTSEDATAFKALATLWKDASKTVSDAVVAQCPLTPGGSIAGVPIGRTPWYERLGWSTRW